MAGTVEWWAESPEFTTVLRGYDPAEVDEYVETLSKLKPEQLAGMPWPTFRSVMRGYDRQQVDGYVERFLGNPLARPRSAGSGRARISRNSLWVYDQPLQYDPLAWVTAVVLLALSVWVMFEAESFAHAVIGLVLGVPVTLVLVGVPLGIVREYVRGRRTAQ